MCEGKKKDREYNMPGFITHSLFAREVLEDLHCKGLQTDIGSRMPLYYLGAQGPDIFFYYKATPWVKYDGVEKLGFIMHDSRTEDFFIESLAYIKSLEKQDHSKYMDLKVYITGYLCHFALDLTAHPFIHYTAGINTKENNSTFRYHIYHKQLESIIDAFMLQLKDGKKAHRFRDFELIEDVERYQEVLEEFYIFIIDRIYGVELSMEQLKSVIGDISHILKVLYDPWHLKIWFFRLFENFYGRHGEITSSMHPRKIDQEIDYLNQNHNTWLHPCRGNIKSSKSFLDLYDDALNEAGQLLESACGFINGELPAAGIRSLIRNRSYSTGIECGTEKDLKYFNSIFEKNQVKSSS